MEAEAEAGEAMVAEEAEREDGVAATAAAAAAAEEEAEGEEEREELGTWRPRPSLCSTSPPMASPSERPPRG